MRRRWSENAVRGLLQKEGTARSLTLIPCPPTTICLPSLRSPHIPYSRFGLDVRVLRTYFTRWITQFAGVQRPNSASNSSHTGDLCRSSEGEEVVRGDEGNGEAGAQTTRPRPPWPRLGDGCSPSHRPRPPPSSFAHLRSSSASQRNDTVCHLCRHPSA
ncbi:hypothetical protein PYCCODRAFT_1280024 [Trametes coccinea BRFM310]|uniref:Uncharacterized protein n=1 Tax=Trametes coccinea (strain BRFM310) TaxID=1353009 RepID=A0A1Y2IXV7_TRAC3|nr:hypothetical protein PYCCODRAFT_1280024 [Trametes coccinea BRFM310]